LRGLVVLPGDFLPVKTPVDYNCPGHLTPVDVQQQDISTSEKRRQYEILQRGLAPVRQLVLKNKDNPKVQCFTRKASFFFEKLCEWLKGSPSVTLLATFRSH